MINPRFTRQKAVGVTNHKDRLTNNDLWTTHVLVTCLPVQKAKLMVVDLTACAVDLIGDTSKLVRKGRCRSSASLGSVLDSIGLGTSMLGMGNSLLQSADLLRLSSSLFGTLLGSLDLFLGSLLGSLGLFLSSLLGSLGPLDSCSGLSSDLLLRILHLLGESFLISSSLL